jgi:DNA-binding NarL/FixJ family response regulator
LNEQEIEVLTLVARGRTSAQIARELKMIKRTVDFHVNNAKVKLGAANRTEAATRAVAAHITATSHMDLRDSITSRGRDSIVIE